MVSLARLCREQDFPAALLDRELSVRWCTPSAASRWPLLGRPYSILPVQNAQRERIGIDGSYK